VFHEIWEANTGADHDQLLQDIEQAVTEVREEKRRRREQKACSEVIKKE